MPEKVWESKGPSFSDTISSVERRCKVLKKTPTPKVWWLLIKRDKRLGHCPVTRCSSDQASDWVGPGQRQLLEIIPIQSQVLLWFSSCLPPWLWLRGTTWPSRAKWWRTMKFWWWKLTFHSNSFSNVWQLMTLTVSIETRFCISGALCKGCSTKFFILPNSLSAGHMRKFCMYVISNEGSAVAGKQ